MNSNKVILVTCLSFIAAVSAKDYIRACYYTNWSVYREGIGNFNLSKHYETGLCTHILYAFAKVAMVEEGGYGIVPYEEHDQTSGYEMLNKHLKGQDKNLKTLLAVGGWNHSSNGFKQMVADKASRAKFIQNSIRYLEKYGFDGLDLDWEYPAQRGSTRDDRKRFSELCEELKAAYQPRSLLVTAAVAAGIEAVETSYEVDRVSNALDLIFLMTYDLHGSWEQNVGHHTDTNLNHPYPSLSLYNTVHHWIKKGAAKEKLILGLAAYGRTWTLKDPCNDWNLGGKGARIGGQPGEYTSETGFLAYYEICQKDWVHRTCTKESSAKAPYGTDGRDFIGYDDEESIVHKINNVMIAKGLGGFMFWTLDLDDFHGNCSSRKYPLIKAATNAAMGRSQVILQCNAITATKCVPLPPIHPNLEVGPNGCRLNEYGPWRGRQDIDTWCKDPENCGLDVIYCGENYPGCTTCMCTCKEVTTTSIPLSTTLPPSPPPSTTTTTLSPTPTPTPASTTTTATTTTSTTTTITAPPPPTTTPTTTKPPTTSTTAIMKAPNVANSECTPLEMYEEDPIYVQFCTSNCFLCSNLTWLKAYCNCGQSNPQKTTSCQPKKSQYRVYCESYCTSSTCKIDYWIDYHCHC